MAKSLILATIASGARVTVAPHRVAVVAAGRTEALPATAAGVGEDPGAVAGGAPAEPVHPAAGQVQRGADAEQGGEHVAEADVVGPVVQVPAVGMVGQPGMSGIPCQQGVQGAGAGPGVLGLDHLEPVVEKHPHLVEIAAAGPAVDHQVVVEAAFGQCGQRGGTSLARSTASLIGSAP